MIPTSIKEVKALGWDYIDVILFTGDAFIDHPSFGTAVIARWLQKHGYRVAVVPQPNWRDDLRDFRKLGAPRLYFGVNSGAMDSMVNHYTAAKRLRSDDAYTPDGRAGQRPDYAVTVYTKILKQIYPDIPVLIGGIEASLRRVTHYDIGRILSNLRFLLTAVPTGCVTEWESVRFLSLPRRWKQDAISTISGRYLSWRSIWMSC